MLDPSRIRRDRFPRVQVILIRLRPYELAFAKPCLISLFVDTLMLLTYSACGGCHGYSPLLPWDRSRAAQASSTSARLRWFAMVGAYLVERLSGVDAERINLLGTDRLKLDPRRQSNGGVWLDDVVNDDWGSVVEASED